MNVSTAPNERMVPSEAAVDAWLEDVTHLAPNIAKDYCLRYGLDELPRPRYVNADMATFYELVKGEYVPTVRNATPSGLVSALEKGLLLAPSHRAVKTEVETEPEPAERADPVEVPEQDGVRYEKCPTCKLEFKLDRAQPLSKARFVKHQNRHKKMAHAK